MQILEAGYGHPLMKYMKMPFQITQNMSLYYELADVIDRQIALAGV